MAKDVAVKEPDLEIVKSPAEKKRSKLERAPRDFCTCGSHLVRFSEDEDWYCLRLAMEDKPTEDCQVVPRELVHDKMSLAEYEKKKAEKHSRAAGINRPLKAPEHILERLKAKKPETAKA